MVCCILSSSFEFVIFCVSTFVTFCVVVFVNCCVFVGVAFCLRVFVAFFFSVFVVSSAGSCPEPPMVPVLRACSKAFGMLRLFWFWLFIAVSSCGDDMCCELLYVLGCFATWIKLENGLSECL